MNRKPDRQAPRFFCDIYCFESGQEQKGHIHGEQDKVYLVLEGQGTFQVGSEKQVLGPGQGTMAPAGEEHGVKNHTTSVSKSSCSWRRIRREKLNVKR